MDNHPKKSKIEDLSKDVQITDLKAKIEVATQNAIQKYTALYKTSNPDLTDEQVLEGGTKLFNKMIGIV